MNGGQRRVGGGNDDVVLGVLGSLGTDGGDVGSRQPNQVGVYLTNIKYKSESIKCD